jgi:hypothetical protein
VRFLDPKKARPGAQVVLPVGAAIDNLLGWLAR